MKKKFITTCMKSNGRLEVYTFIAKSEEEVREMATSDKYKHLDVKKVVYIAPHSFPCSF